MRNRKQKLIVDAILIAIVATIVANIPTTQSSNLDSLDARNLQTISGSVR